MTYFGFLFIFLVAPIFLLLFLWQLQRQLRRTGIPSRHSWRSVLPATLAMVILALGYTTPWDNYLVATRVWWYDPALVSGLVIGWVPIEEYTFFVLQPILGSLWLANLAKPSIKKIHTAHIQPRLHRGAVWLVALWSLAGLALILDLPAATYLGLELIWALPPLALQVAFGGDLLWRYRKLAVAGIVPLTVYLSLADSLAIFSGTWTINPDKSLGIYLGGVLPLEEAIFFLLTNLLITFGVILIWAPESRARLRNWVELLRGSMRRRGTDSRPINVDAGRPPR